MERRDYLSCDNVDDAIYSLAKAYLVSVDRVKDMALNWPDDLGADVETTVFEA